MNVIDVSYVKSSATVAPQDMMQLGPEPAPIPATTAAAEDSSSAPPVQNRAYPAPAAVPTQEGPKGIRFDFNDGCRVVLPERDHPWRVRLGGCKHLRPG